MEMTMTFLKDLLAGIALFAFFYLSLVVLP
jgi:hypothetical protein